jgi:hypothetical protein
MSHGLWIGKFPTHLAETKKLTYLMKLVGGSVKLRYHTSMQTPGVSHFDTPLSSLVDKIEVPHPQCKQGAGKIFPDLILSR